MSDGLNPPQAEAVDHKDGPLLVFAGAGSGKTRVITYRTAKLIADHGVDPGRVLLVTFTNKAANEMKERLVGLVGEHKTKRLWAGTFHAVCARILRASADDIDRRSDFVVYDETDQETVVKQIFQELELDKKTYAPSKLLARIQDAKQKAYAPGDIPVLDDDTRVFVDVWDRYDAWLRASNAVDFEDLILLTMRLAEGSRNVGAMLRARFDYLLVDEFQDTNYTQYRLVQALALRTRNLCVVGDDDQCIYTWRGADPRNIREFKKEYPDATIVRLEQNYRSTKRIVACAAALIAKNTLRTPKTLWTANPDGRPVELVETGTDRQEADLVCARIRGLINAGGRPSDAVVLYRTHAQSRAIEDQLRDWQVPYRIVGGHRFYDRKEIKDMFAYLRLLTNHDSDVDLLRVINVPPRGIGPTTVKRMSEIASSRATRLWAAIPVAELAPEIGRKERLQLGAFRSLIEDFSRTASAETPSELTKRLIDGLGYRLMWEREAQKLSKDGKSAEADDAMARVENLDELVNAVAAYEARARADGSTPSLGDYVQMVSLLAEESRDERADKVLLMTVHAAKGLEFPYVFLVGCEEGRFPMRSADLNPMELEEERRLAYVAITRARERLTITHARMRFVRGVAESCAPSRFLFDLPPDAVSRAGGGASNPNKSGWL
jgi:DNA helicase II / ATP-dependent DNA helicase PcrA